MKRFLYIMTIFLLLVPASFVKAEEAYTTEVYDLANVLTKEDEASLKSVGFSISSECNINVIFLTANDTKGKSSMEYSDDFYDGIEGPICYGEDGIICFVDLDNGYDYIGTTGAAIRQIDDYEIEQILDAAFEIPEEDYYLRLYTLAHNAYFAFKNETYIYDDFTANSGSSYHPDFFDCVSVFFLTILRDILPTGLIIALLYKFHHGHYSHVIKSLNKDNTEKGFIKTNEYLLRSYERVNRNYYKRSSSSGSSRSSGGGSSHRSSSGRSHGGGGRKR